MIGQSVQLPTTDWGASKLSGYATGVMEQSLSILLQHYLLSQQPPLYLVKLLPPASSHSDTDVIVCSMQNLFCKWNWERNLWTLLSEETAQAS